MNSSPRCQACGALLAEGNSGQHCPACLLRSVLEVTDAPDGTADADSFPRSFGNYELLGEIGRGGMGLVFRARQLNLDRVVALKVLLTGRYADDVSRRRFRFEAEAAAKLQHPNIVTVHEVGEFDGQPYFTMDLVDGPNLAELCEANPLPAKEAARLVRDVAAAIASAHAHGVLHRDLKPSNVLIGSDRRPRVTDFGMAKLTDNSRDLTAPGQLVGSPNYSSPEQAAGDTAAISTASDVYGIGALLYHLLTGHAPFGAATPAATLRLVLETEVPPPRLLDPTVPRDLETICLKCLEKAPERRYSSAGEITAELTLFLADEPIRARRISRVEATWRWCRRRPAIAALSALAVLLLAGTAVVSTLAARRIGRAQKEEHAARLAAEESLYASDMQVIGAGFDAALGGSPRDNLQRLLPWRSKAGERDLRGFEWRYFWTRNRGDALGTFRGHHHLVDAIVLSPDGTRVASHSFDGVVKVWDRERRQELRTIDSVAAVGGFSVDGRQLIFSRRDGEIDRLDLTSGGVTRARAATGRLIAVQPDGQQAVVFGPRHLPALRALDDSGLPEKGFDVPPDTVGVVSRDGQRAAVAGRPYAGVVVADPATSRIVATLPERRPIISLAISPDGKRLVAGSFDAVLNVWDVDRGVVERTFKPFLDPMWGLAFSPDGKMFAAGGHNRAIKVWDASTWQLLETLAGHESTIVSLAFSNDGQRLVSGAEDELSMVWPLHNVRPPDEMRRALRGPDYVDRTPGLAFSPDSKLMVGTAADRTVKVWRTTTFECTATFADEVRNVAFAADGQSILGEGYDGVVRRWSLTDSARPAEASPLARPSVPIANWLFDPLTTEQRVAVFAEQQASRVPCTLCEISSFRDGITAGAPATASTLAVTSDGATLFAGLPNGKVEVWDVASRKQRFVLTAHKVPVTALAVSPDGHFLATGGLDNSTGLWDVATGRAVTRFYEHNRPVWALAFSPDGKTLAAGSCDKAIKLFSVGLQRCVASLPLYTGLPTGYEQEIRLLRFSPDGTILAAALGDGTIRFFRAEPFAVTDAEQVR